MESCTLEEFRQTPYEFFVPLRSGLPCKTKMLQAFFAQYQGYDFMSQGTGSGNEPIQVTATKENERVVMWVFADPTKEEIAVLGKTLTMCFDSIRDGR